MARKNKNAGQPNRGAQTLRRATRRQTDQWYRPRRNNAVDYDTEEDERVPSSASEGEVITREVYLVRELVAA
jgi:hypothetical protein